MSETNDTSKFAALEDHRPLADSELDAVAGGTTSEPFRKDPYRGASFRIDVSGIGRGGSD